MRFQVKKKQFFRNFMTIMLFGALGTLISFTIISLGSIFFFQKLDVDLAIVARKYFVKSISKAYQVFQMGIALPQFLLNIDGASSGVLLIGIVEVCILLPLVMAVIYLSRSSKYTGNYVKNDTLGAYFHLMKPSLAPSLKIFSAVFMLLLCEFPLQEAVGIGMLTNTKSITAMIILEAGQIQSGHIKHH